MSHVQEIILLENIFDCPFKLILGFSTFMAINQNIDTQLCTHMKNYHHKMNYFEMEYSIFLI